LIGVSWVIGSREQMKEAQIVLAGLGIFLILLRLMLGRLFSFSFRWYRVSDGVTAHGPTYSISPFLWMGCGVLLLSMLVGRRLR